MENKERVVVAVPLDCKHNASKTVFVARIHALGLTAYGENLDNTKLKAKKMFAKWVDLNRRGHTLEENLNRSGLTWYYENEYQGASPYERVLPDGQLESVGPQSKKDGSWAEVRDMVVAR